MRFARRALASVARRLAPRAGRRTATAALAGAERLGFSERAGRVLAREAERRLDAGDLGGTAELLDAFSRWPRAAAAGRWRKTLAGWQYRLGRAREKAGEWELAAAAYQQANALDGGRPAWREALARAAAKAPRWTLSIARRQAPDGPAAGAVAPPGKRLVTGWVPAATGDAGRVQLKLNGTVIADTSVAGEVTVDGERYRGFRRHIQDLWSYAGSGDVLAVEHAGRPLHIVDSGQGYTFTGAESRAGELLALLGDGHVFNKYGRVLKSIQEDTDWQSMMFELFFQLRKELDGGFGLQLFPFYGTMLGAVREQNFIGHDNDFDTVYISGHSEPAAVRDEFRAVCDFLVDRGYSLRVKKTHTWVRIPGTGRELDKFYTHKLDIFFAWFDEEGFLQTSYGHHGPAVRRSDDFFQFRNERLGIREVPVPHNAEDILVQLYGPGWREPDPGFTHFSPTRVMHDEFQLGVGEANEPYWRQFYRQHRVDGASSFARFVAERLPAACTLIDVGCGSGRDSIYLAQCGHTVVGVDRSESAITRARETCQEAGVEGVRFQPLDASSRLEIERCLSRLPAPAAGGTEIVVYLRFFLHSVDEATEDALLAALVDLLPGGFRLCAEFRTKQDGRLPKVYGDHYRRYIDEQEFAEKLRRGWGFMVEHLEAGRGLSPYEGEDPHLARIVAQAPVAGKRHAAAAQPAAG